MTTENKDIRSIAHVNDIVECIEKGTYGEAPASLISFYEQLPKTRQYDHLRVMAVPYLFHAFEKNVLNDTDAIQWFIETLDRLRTLVSKICDSGAFIEIMDSFSGGDHHDAFEDEVDLHTGRHYGNLFRDFDHASYFNEAKELLKTRLDRNGIELPSLATSSVLDQGCGGGRYTTAWKMLGAATATGIDISEIGLDDARARVRSINIPDVTFINGSVLDMPFKDESFDIVYSNGVLHHTEDWRTGIKEQLRVMKKGGWGWQYLIENPGGIFWDKVEILRAIMKDVNKEFAQLVMKTYGIPGNRIFYMLDHVMVPINSRIDSAEIIKELEKNGAINIKRLERGTDFDRIEAINRGIPYAKEKFGIGENRYVFNKA